MPKAGPAAPGGHTDAPGAPRPKKDKRSDVVVFTLGALMVNYTILGAPFCNYSIIYTKTPIPIVKAPVVSVYCLKVV